MADIGDLKSPAHKYRRTGSSPVPGTDEVNNGRNLY